MGNLMDKLILEKDYDNVEHYEYAEVLEITYDSTEENASQEIIEAAIQMLEDHGLKVKRSIL